MKLRLELQINPVTVCDIQGNLETHYYPEYELEFSPFPVSFTCSFVSRGQAQRFAEVILHSHGWGNESGNIWVKEV